MGRKWVATFGIVVLAFAGCAGNVVAGEGKEFNLNLRYGTKNMDSNDWEPVEKHDEAGFQADFREKHWPVSISVGYSQSKSDSKTVTVPITGFGLTDVKVEGESSEIDVGLRKNFDTLPVVRPFLGGGLSIVSVDFSTEFPSSSLPSVSESDQSIGFWLAGGVYFTLIEHLNLGVELKLSRATVTLFDEDFEGGGEHLAAFIGYHY